MSWLPLGAAEAASIIKTDDGLEFSFGMAQKVVFFTLDGLDLTSNACGGKDCNFRSFISPDSQTGSNPVGIWNFTNILFTLSKGPVSIHTNLELEAAIDENVADINHLNLERANLTWKTGVIGDLVVGFDVHLFDPEGGLVYQDEDPGIWLIGNAGIVSWNIGYHKRLERNTGKPLGNLIGGFGTFQDGRVKDTDRDTDILEARVGFNLGAISISPFFLAHIRHTPGAAGTNIFSCPGAFSVDAAGTPFCGATNISGLQVDGRLRGEIYYPGLVVTGKLGPLSFTAEGVGMFGEVRELGPNFQAIYGTSQLDVESFAVYGELALDLTAQGLGITPFVAIDWRRGDDNPTDATLKGYVPISDLSAALRKDGFKGQSISSLGPPILGAGGEDGWGFNTTGRGIGPTIGTILEGFGADNTFFNSRWGKGDNPGMMKATAGFLGKITPQVDMKAAVSYFRFDSVESIQAEALLNRIARGAPATSFNISEDMGFEINANIGWSPVPAFRIQPFVSVFVPLDGAKDINRLFLDSNNDRTAYLGGVEFRAQF
jgi:hypothetical protein